MTQAIGEYGFLDMTNIVYQRSATIDVLITKIPEVAATLPKQVVIFTGLNDCNHYTEIADYRRLCNDASAAKGIHTRCKDYRQQPVVSIRCAWTGASRFSAGTTV